MNRQISRSAGGLLPALAEPASSQRPRRSVSASSIFSSLVAGRSSWGWGGPRCPPPGGATGLRAPPSCRVASRSAARVPLGADDDGKGFPPLNQELRPRNWALSAVLGTRALCPEHAGFRGSSSSMPSECVHSVNITSGSLHDLSCQAKANTSRWGAPTWPRWLHGQARPAASGLTMIISVRMAFHRLPRPWPGSLFPECRVSLTPIRLYSSLTIPPS
jgi:hypothetical protein